ncbi:MAG: hypothetical protein ABIO02_01625 [Patescibacteria group bacterium]
MKRILLGILAITPLVFFVIILYVVLFNNTSSAWNTLGMPAVICTLVTWTTLVLYIMDIVKNNKIKGESKPLWVAGLLFFGMILLPIYWFRFILKD